MTDTATLEARLAEAETAHHKLMTGQSAATVSTEGESVSYTRARIADLERYITSLKQRLGRTRRVTMRPQ